LVQLAVIYKHANHVSFLALPRDFPQSLICDVCINANARQQAASGARIIDSSRSISDLHKSSFR
jgi:hypothetical protein